jgi:hypothetical protein
MTRSRFASVALALSLSVALAGVAFAKGPHDKSAKHARPDRAAAEKQVKLKVAATPRLKAKANAAQLGGVLHLNVVLHAARADRPATCLAVVHFLSGDVPNVILTRSGGGASYHAAVPVSLTETPGPVSFDATCLVGTALTPLTATGWGKIQPGGTETEAADVPESPETPDAADANVVVPDLGGLTQEQRQALFDQLVALLAKLLGVSAGSAA